MQSDLPRAVPPIYAASSKDHYDWDYGEKPTWPTHVALEVEPDNLSRGPSPAFQRNDRSTVSASKRRCLYIPNTLWTRSFAITVIIETIVTVAVESWIFISISKHHDGTAKEEATRSLRSFVGLYIFALLYELWLSYDALRRKNTIQLVGVCICNAGLLTYGCLQIGELNGTISSMVVNDDTFGTSTSTMYHIALILVPVFLGIGSIVMSLVTWKLRAEFSWSIYKNISADLQMNSRYFTYQIYIALLKFDFFFIFGSQLQILLNVIEPDSTAFIANAATIPITMVALILAARFCKREKKKSLIAVMVLMVIIAACFVLTLIAMHTPGASEEFSSVEVSLTLFAVITIMLITFTLITSVVCICNFNKGLKRYIDTSKKRQKANDSYELRGRDADTRFLLN